MRRVSIEWKFGTREFLISAIVHLLALQNMTHRTPRRKEDHAREGHPTFGKQTNIFFCYASTFNMEQCNAIN